MLLITSRPNFRIYAMIICIIISYSFLDAERRKQSSSPFEDTKSSSLRKGQGTTDETEYITSSTFSKVGRGGSVKALSQKFQQVAG